MAITDLELEATQHPTVDRLVGNVAKLEDLFTRLTNAMSNLKTHDPRLEAPDPHLFERAAQAYWTHAMKEPVDFLRSQVSFWGSSAMNFASMQSHAMMMKPHVHNDADTDRRFDNPAWDANPFLHMILQQYRINADALTEAVEAAEDLSTKEKQRLTYFAEQIVNLSAPSNFLPTNPEALQRALDSDGTSLVDGLENLVRDLEANDGELLVRLADEEAFKLGENIATTPGEVIFRNDMMELIQYAPATEQVRELPIVLFPPWINKFYILDLKEKNSLIKWITDQGYTLFVVSWMNPDESRADVGLEDYIERGYLTAIETAKEVCGVDKVNAVGYCIAGTTLSLTLGIMKARGDTSVNSATFFTTLTDFSEQGEFTPFLQDDFVSGIEAQAAKDGVLKSHIMARTFSFLRSNDLVYGPAIRSYMYGEAPPAFDLLYWNGDGTNLPRRMVTQYLRKICQGNQLASDGIEICGEVVSLKDVKVPLMAITCETDHIAPWADCYRGVAKMGSKDKTFIVSESGHIAGIVNPPSKKKYGHYTRAQMPKDAQKWMAKATFTEGSWWPRWEAWISERSGDMIPARRPEQSLAPAPGTYVLKA